MILAIIQARMSSTRLPRKSMMPICGKPMLQWVIEAAQSTEMVDKVVVAISNKPEDEYIADFAVNYADVFPGDLEDVLNRFYRASLFYKPRHIVRLTADCPMSEPGIMDEVIKEHLSHGYDYTSNRPWFPSGLDVEVFSFDTLLRAAKLATSPHDREHVTPFMKSGLFKWGGYRNYEGDKDAKLSVDTLDDFKRVEKEMRNIHQSRWGTGGEMGC